MKMTGEWFLLVVMMFIVFILTVGRNSRAVEDINEFKGR